MPNSIGHYELHEALGTGALGVTYRARDTRTDATVALKLLHESLTLDAAAAARLRREARAASALDHPNIAHVVEYGEDAGDLYIASEFAEGETLRVRLQRDGCLSEAETHGVAVCVAHALNAADAVRVVHRNLTPENILLSEDGQLRLCDFGITQAIDAATPTSYAAFIAAPAYAAPELRERRGDIRSDLYSLGAIMFEALTGAPPLDLNRNGAAARGDAAKSPKFAALNRARSLAPIVQRLLKPDPRDRYADPVELLRALQSVGSLASTRIASTVSAPPAPAAVAAPAPPPPPPVSEAVARPAPAPAVEAVLPVAPVPAVAPAPSTRIEKIEQEVSPARAVGAQPARRGLGAWMSKLAGRRPVVVDTAQLLADRLDGLVEGDALTTDQEAAFFEFAASLGVERPGAYPLIQQRLIAARANDGRLPVVDAAEAHCALRPGETVYLEASCDLLAGAGGMTGAGFDFPVVRGRRYYRGPDKLHDLGAEAAVAEGGILSVTSQRVVFSGPAESHESLYSRLVFLRIFSDGLGISVSNRQHISTYRLLDTSGEAVAAVINTAVQKLS